MTTTDESRAAAIDWLDREINFWLDDHGQEDDEIGRELRSVLGASLDLPGYFGRSQLSIQQAAAYIAGQRTVAVSTDTECAGCRATAIACESRRWLSGRPCCTRCDHPPVADLPPFERTS